LVSRAFLLIERIQFISTQINPAINSNQQSSNPAIKQSSNQAIKQSSNQQVKISS